MKDISRILAFLVISATLLVSCAEEKSSVKVVVLGFDGANWETIDPLIESGKLPFLEQLKENGSWGYLRTFRPTKSPVIVTPTSDSIRALRLASDSK